MSIWKSLFTAVRGGINEAGEAVADSQSLRILDQEIRDSESKLGKARADLATLMGKEKIAGDKVSALRQKYDRDLLRLDQLVAKDSDVELQQELAERIATLEGEIEAEGSTLAEYTQTRAMLQRTVSDLTSKIASVKRDVDKVKVTASVQDAQKSIMAQGSGISSTVGGAAATLARIKEQQAGKAATFQAQMQIEDATSGKDLDRRLAEAGVGDAKGSANLVLERARSRRAAAEALPAPQKTLAIGSDRPTEG